MRYSAITYTDVNNGLGNRVTLWINGCKHQCEGCHNKETWQFNKGKLFDEDKRQQLFDILSLPYVKGLTLSGGDPLYSYNEVLPLCKEVKDKFKDKDIWLYTGFTFDEIREQFTEILEYVDYVVDGRYEKDKRDVTLAFRGSTNQHIWHKDDNTWNIIDKELK